MPAQLPCAIGSLLKLVTAGTYWQPNLHLSSCSTSMAGVQAGLDSLGAVDLRNAVAARWSLPVPATLAFDFPTIASLAQFVASKSSRPAPAQVLQLACLARAQLEQLKAAEAEVHHVQAQFMPASTSAAVDVLPRLLSMIAAILGAEVAPDQPLMEVTIHACSL